MKKITLLNDTGLDGNWGCRTTSKYLKGQLSGKNNNVYSIPISFSSSIKERLSGHMKTIFLTLNLIFMLKMLKPLFKFYFLNISWNKNHYRNIYESDHVFLNGEGTIHVYNRAVSKWMFYLLVSKFVFDKKYSIVNHTFNLDTQSVRCITNKAYSNASNIFVRELISKEVIINNLNVQESVVRVVADAAFLVDFYEINERFIENKYFTICGNVISNGVMIENLTKLVLKIQKELDLVPVFLIADKKDETFYQALKNDVKGIVKLENDVDINEALNVISNSEFFITGRFHPYIFSLVLDKLTFTFDSNTHKIKGVKEMMNDTTPKVSLTNANTDFLMIKNELNKNNQNNTCIKPVSSVVHDIRNNYNRVLREI